MKAECPCVASSIRGRRCGVERRKLMFGLTAMAVSLGEVEGGAQVRPPGNDAVYELRIYHLNEGKQPLIVDRFRTTERPLLERHGMQAVAFWVPTDQPLAARTFVYILRHRSRAAADENWANFKADPDWVTLKAETEKDGAFVNRYDITFLKLTDFSARV
jgi:NIPSNAP protein